MLLPIPARRATVATILLVLTIHAGHAEAAREPTCAPPTEAASQLDHQLAAWAKDATARGDIDAALRYTAAGTRLDLKAPALAAIAPARLAALVETRA